MTLCDSTLIGEGRFSQVYRIQEGDVILAQKRVKNRTRALTEAKILESLSHQNIVKLHGFQESHEEISLLLAYRPFDLWAYLSENRLISYSEFLYLGSQLFQGLSYLHSHHVVHHDIKPHNVLVNELLEVNICDFGSACYLERGSHLTDGLGKGTTPYLAPEILKLEEYDHSVDVYSMGVLLWVLLTGRMPFDDISSPIKMNIAIKEGGWFEFPATCLDGSRYHPSVPLLISRCLSVNPAKRPTAEEMEASFAELIEVLD